MPKPQEPHGVHEARRDGLFETLDGFAQQEKVDEDKKLTFSRCLMYVGPYKFPRTTCGDNLQATDERGAKPWPTRHPDTSESQAYLPRWEPWCQFGVTDWYPGCLVRSLADHYIL